ncbi:uncharacterized protein yc1106_03247 [Curvularia clavata]|uniref:Uncharacterized protein n=1 Tax=Curvularia clavata TaxID=95742 RepID=A0A9Q8Z818_CURCL|nr:uncharacterized protein yc1106_03247 [Curvularia clavata]
MTVPTALRTLRQQPLLRALPNTLHSARPFTCSASDKKLMDTPKPASNIPDPHPNSSAAPNAKVRSDSQHTDQQSSASRDEAKQGDDHPAKQPDFQEKPDRTTGIGGGDRVKGGKEGVDERT